MTKNQKLKLGAAMVVVSYGTQFALLRPGEGFPVALVLGTLSLGVTLLVGWIIVWIAKP